MRLFILLIFCLPLIGISQDPLSDTIKKLDSLETINKEQNPNYFGFNITPLMSGIVAF